MFNPAQCGAPAPDDYFLESVCERVGGAQQFDQMSDAATSADIGGVYAENHTALDAIGMALRQHQHVTEISLIVARVGLMDSANNSKYSFQREEARSRSGYNV
jgi:hypothetical protein